MLKAILVFALLVLLVFGIAQVYPPVGYKSTYLPLPYFAADDAPVPVFTVDLKADTYCGTLIHFFYGVAGAGEVGARSGIATYSLVNKAGVVSGNVALSNEVSAGVGCTLPICASASMAMTGEHVTAYLRFDNTLGTAGQISFQVISNTCLMFTPL